MKRSLSLFAVVAFCAMRTPRATAGIADSPVPLLAGQKAQVLYSVTGVQNGGGLGTYFFCTSTGNSSVRVSVELFGAAGGDPVNDASAVAEEIAAGAGVAFGTRPSLTFVANGLGTNAQSIINGAARILATSKSLICTALLSDFTSAPPKSMSALTVVAKTKQKGD